MSTYYADIDSTVNTQTPYEARYGAGTWPGIGTELRPFTDGVFAALGGYGTGNTFNFKGATVSGGVVALLGGNTYQSWDNEDWSVAANVITIQNYYAGDCVVSGGRLKSATTLSFVLSDAAVNVTLINTVCYALGAIGFTVSAGGGGTTYLRLYGSSIYSTSAPVTTHAGNPSATVFIDILMVDSIWSAPAIIQSKPYTYFKSVWTNCATNRNYNTLIDGTCGSFSYTKTQWLWTPPALPAWDADEEDWRVAVLGAGLLSESPNGAAGKPNPGDGAPSYTGYEKGLFDSDRAGIGAMYFGIVAPVITSDPTSTAKQQYENATFSVVATGDPTLVYEWHRDGSEAVLTDSDKYAGTGTATLFVLHVGADDDGATFECWVTNGGGYDSSAAATLTVTPYADPRAITDYSQRAFDLLPEQFKYQYGGA